MAGVEDELGVGPAKVVFSQKTMCTSSSGLCGD